MRVTFICHTFPSCPMEGQIWYIDHGKCTTLIERIPNYKTSWIIMWVYTINQWSTLHNNGHPKNRCWHLLQNMLIFTNKHIYLWHSPRVLSKHTEIVYGFLTIWPRWPWKYQLHVPSMNTCMPKNNCVIISSMIDIWDLSEIMFFIFVVSIAFSRHLTRN
jgi:hypothetical protein